MVKHFVDPFSTAVNNTKVPSSYRTKLSFTSGWPTIRKQTSVSDVYLILINLILLLLMRRYLQIST